MLATYRLQLTPNLDFRAACDVIDHVSALGISHLYLSPIFEARSGSTHGYDLTDHTQIRAALGGDDGFREFVNTVRRSGLRLLLDIVPNHMAADAANPWWWDVLRHGRESTYADYFDICWSENDGRIVLPVLGASLDEILRAGEILLDRGSPFDASETVIRYRDRVLPVAPETLGRTARSNVAMPELLAAQHYELTFWRDGLRRINYRRFFDISDLVAVRVQDEKVFHAVHERVIELVEVDMIAGVRVDHVDGLHDPVAYLRRLRDALDRASQHSRRYRANIVIEKILSGEEQVQDSWPVSGTTGYEFANQTTRLFVDVSGFATIEADAIARGSCSRSYAQTMRQAKQFVFNDLFPAERDRLCALLLDVARARGDETLATSAMQRAIVDLTSCLDVYRTYITEDRLADADRTRIVHALNAASELSAGGDDDVRDALSLLRFTLLTGVTSTNRRIKDASLAFAAAWQMITGAVMAKGAEDTALYRHISLTSLNEVGGEPELPDDPVARFHQANVRRTAHWPQTMNATATHDTKRGEDTRARVSVLSEIADQWTAALDRWMDWHKPIHGHFNDSAAPCASDELLIYQSYIGIAPFPETESRDPAELARRLQQYMLKVGREAKLQTSWYDPDEQYEQAVRDFIEQLIVGKAGLQFRRDVVPILKVAAFHGAINSFAQVLLKVTSPGVPDFYQGTELWALTLVDPDNRQPLDLQRLTAARRELPDPGPARSSADADALRDLREHWPDGRIKMFITRRSLAARQAFADVFQSGEYVPLSARGEKAHHIVVFARRSDHQWIIVAVPRLSVSITGETGSWPLGRAAWADTALVLPELAPKRWIDQLTGASCATNHGQIELATAFELLPIALLVSE